MSFRTNNSFGCIVLLFIITIGVILTLNSSLSKSEYYLGCSSSEECYSLFKDKAKSFQTKGIELFRLSNPNDESIGQKDAINSIYNPDSRMNDPNISGTEETLHPQVAKNAFEPPVKAAFVVLARNDEVFRLMSSMRHLENRFNKKFNYPWVFLNEEPFSDEFKELTSKMTNAEVHYGLIPVEHWSYPDWINQTFAAEARVEMGKNHVGKGEIEAYHHMIRYQSGFFMKHPLLEDMDYYWRVEPGVKFSCDIDYDAFKVMQDRDLKYGFTVSLREMPNTMPTLWANVIEFMNEYPQYLTPKNSSDSLFAFVSQDDGVSYNRCHFWSNFEIGSLKFMRSEGYQAFFNFLDRKNGFYYERWGDAPVHSIGAAMMLKREDVHWFYDIGYDHDGFEHCPLEPSWLINDKCDCDPATSFLHRSGSCHKEFMWAINKTGTDFIVAQPNSQIIL